MHSYWKVPGLADPYWVIRNDIAHPLAADTDMGDGDEAEFHAMFPHAIRVTSEEAYAGTEIS